MQETIEVSDSQDAARHLDAGCSPSHRRGGFFRHYLEMLVAMLAGMVVLGAAVRGASAVAGLELPTEDPEFASLEVAAYMAIGMGVWMRHRGHGCASTFEMAGAMFVPSLALFPFLWVGVISASTLLVLEHIAMLPLMYFVMMRRRNEYGG